MALNNVGLGFLFTAKDLASATMGRISTAFKGLESQSAATERALGTTLGNMGAGLAIFGGGAAALNATFAAAEHFGEFERGIAGVAAKTRASAEDLAMLRDKAIEAGIATQFSPEQAVEGLTKLATSGMTARQSAAALIPVLDLAASSLGALGLGEAAEAVAGTLHSFGLNADEAAKITDKLTKITQISHFQANDFAGGLSKSAAAAGVFGQSLDDVLVVMGLLRNRNIDASSASTAYREAIRRLASDSGAQAAVTQAQIDIFDRQSGKMRSMIDIMQDIADKTRDWTDQNRNKLVVDAFGARGLLAFAAVQKAMFTQTKNGVQTTYEGAEAIAKMREEMSQSSGVAAEFRDKLLATYEGQKILLRGSMQTLQIVTGEGFAGVFKPAVSMVIDLVNAMIAAIQKTPAPVKRAISIFLVAASALTTLVGGIILAKAAVSLFGLALSAMGMSIGGLFVGTVLPAVAVLAAVTIGVVAFRRAVASNLGGFGDFVSRAVSGARLAFEALGQLFDQGGFSGKVRAELGRAENAGIRNFAIRVYLLVNRIQTFFDGLATGFGATIERFGPVFDAFAGSVRKLGAAFGFASDAIDPAQAGTAFAEWTAGGRQLGAVLGRTVVVLVQLATLMVEILAAVAPIVVALAGLVASFVSTETGAIVLKYALLALAAYGIVRASAALVSLGYAAVGAAVSLGRVVVQLVAMRAISIGSMAASAAAGMRTLVGAAAAGLGPIGAIVAAITAWAVAIDQVLKLSDELGEHGWGDMLNKLTHDLGISSDAEYRRDLGIVSGAEYDRMIAAAPKATATATGPVRVGTTTVEHPGVAATAAVAGAAAAAPNGADLANAAGSAAVAAARATAPSVLNATMIVDGEVLGRVAAKAQRGAAQRSYVDVPVEE